MSYTSDIWLYPLQDWWRIVNEMSDFMSTGQMGNFIFHNVKNPHNYISFGCSMPVLSVGASWQRFV